MKIEVINKSNFDLPKYESERAAGMDLQANIEKPITLKPLERILIKSGLHMAIPNGYEAQIRSRSGISLNHGITVVNGIGTIDSDYRGDVGIPLINLSNEEYVINPGDKIAQMVINKYEIIEFELVDELDKTKRGKGGFGHTSK